MENQETGPRKKIVKNLEIQITILIEQNAPQIKKKILWSHRNQPMEPMLQELKSYQDSNQDCPV